MVNASLEVEYCNNSSYDLIVSWDGTMIDASFEMEYCNNSSCYKDGIFT